MGVGVRVGAPDPSSCRGPMHQTRPDPRRRPRVRVGLGDCSSTGVRVKARVRVMARVRARVMARVRARVWARTSVRPSNRGQG